MNFESPLLNIIETKSHIHCRSIFKTAKAKRIFTFLLGVLHSNNLVVRKRLRPKDKKIRTNPFSLKIKIKRNVSSNVMKKKMHVQILETKIHKSFQPHFSFTGSIVGGGTNTSRREDESCGLTSSSRP